MKKRSRIIMLSLVLVISAALIVTFGKDWLASQEKEPAQQAAETGDKSDYVAKIDKIIVTREVFEKAKINSKLLAEAAGNFQEKSDDEIIKQLLTNKLVIEDAKSKGLTVSNEEVAEMIKQQRELMELADDKTENYTFISELLSKLMALKGITEEEYWDSQMVEEGYLYALYSSKLYTYLLDNNHLDSFTGFDEYQDNLFRQKQDSLEKYL